MVYEIHFYISISTNVECYKVNWPYIYHYVFHTNYYYYYAVYQMTLYFTFKCHPGSKFMRQTEISHIASYMRFTETLVKASTRFEMLAK